MRAMAMPALAPGGREGWGGVGGVEGSLGLFGDLVGSGEGWVALADEG